MDFFDSKDWLGQEGPYAYRWDHLLFVFIPLVFGVLLALFLRKRSKKAVKAWTIGLWAFGTSVVAFYYISKYVICAIDPVGHPFLIDKMLPFHSCLMFMYVFPFAMFSKNRVVRTAANNFLVVVNMIIGFITLFVGCPPKGSSALSLIGVQSMIIHTIIVIVPMILVVTNYYDIQKKDIKYGLALFGILCLSMWIFDAVAHCDYFYIYDGRTFGILYEISENVPHIVWTLIVVTCYVLTAIIMHFTIIGIKALIHKRQAK